MDLNVSKLIGKHVYLEPLTHDHLEGLTAVGLDPSLWDFTLDRIADKEGILAYIDSALAGSGKGSAVPFVTRLVSSDKIVGSTRFGNIDAAHRRAEIGWTWVSPQFQRSAVNTEAKLLMLSHAFESWKSIRVEFKTDATNLKSRQALARLGAVEEGILRQHMITSTGRYRDTVYFSILDNEWPQVKANLTQKLGRIYE